MRLRALAPAKVNLSLFLGPTREDRRHELVTVFQSLSLADVVELEVPGESEEDVVVCPQVPGENLASLALAALRRRGWDGPPATVWIDKLIPIAAGMAGGSADAAATLRLAMAVAPGRAEEVDEIAAELGSDVPSQLAPGLSLGTGAGDIVEHFEPLVEHAYVVVPSELSLATVDVYREADRIGLSRTLAELERHYLDLTAALAMGGRLADQLLVNDLERAAVSLCPSIVGVLEAVLAAGAEHAMVSGSGPTVVGLWWGGNARMRASRAALSLSDQFPGAVVADPVTAEFALPSLISRADLS
jgi:4-diphosphocytidyl-2-C-methyl-D-erythritol kinase